MKRLTTYRTDGRAAIANNDRATPLQQTMKIPNIIDRLAAIEDILGNEYDLDRLRELAQADKENRVLPEGSGWFVTCSGKKLTVVMDIEAALRRKQDG